MDEKRNDRVSELLTLAADMESFAPVGDSLSDWAERFDESELYEDELDLISAAGSAQSFAAFRRKFGLD